MEGLEREIEKGVDVNKTNDNGCTPLHYSAQSGHFAVTQLLLEKGGDVNAVDKKWRTPLSLASWIQSWKCFSWCCATAPISSSELSSSNSSRPLCLSEPSPRPDPSVSDGNNCAYAILPFAMSHISLAVMFVLVWLRVKEIDCGRGKSSFDNSSFLFFLLLSRKQSVVQNAAKSHRHSE